MKKLSKINLKLDKEVISSLSGNEMNNVKGGTLPTLRDYESCGICPITYAGDASCPIDGTLCFCPITEQASECQSKCGYPCVVTPTMQKECFGSGSACTNCINV